MSEITPKQFSFLSPLANMLFDTAPEPDRAQYEADLVDRFIQAISMVNSRGVLLQHAQMIDSFLLPKLSGRGMLVVAKHIESRAPAAIDLMPRLHALRSHAERARELSQILSPVALSRVIEALKAAEAGADAGRERLLNRG